jgi:hypothetical protein
VDDFVVHLFSRSGSTVAAVIAPLDAEVILWDGRFFRLDAGRYVESKAFTATKSV